MSIESIRDALRRDVRSGAVALLGAELVHGELRARIVETEAYRGSDDPGSHAHRGQTPRCEVMFGPAGIAYVYFTYGMHWMLNVSALEEGAGAAVLIRAAIPLEGTVLMRERRSRAKSDKQLLAGPACLCAAFGIDRRHNGWDLFAAGSPLRIQAGRPPSAVVYGPRVGLAAGKGEKTRWRFADADALEWISKPKGALARLYVPPEEILPIG